MTLFTEIPNKLWYHNMCWVMQDLYHSKCFRYSTVLRVTHWQPRQNAEKPEFGLARPTCTNGQKGLEPERKEPQPERNDPRRGGEEGGRHIVHFTAAAISACGRCSLLSQGVHNPTCMERLISKASTTSERRWSLSVSRAETWVLHRIRCMRPLWVRPPQPLRLQIPYMRTPDFFCNELTIRVLRNHSFVCSLMVQVESSHDRHRVGAGPTLPVKRAQYRQERVLV